MMRLSRVIIGFGCLLSMIGCQMLRHPVSESTVDQELTSPAPTTPVPEASHDEPRAGFEQESPKSQQP